MKVIGHNDDYLDRAGGGGSIQTEGKFEGLWFRVTIEEDALEDKGKILNNLQESKNVFLLLITNKSSKDCTWSAVPYALLGVIS